VLAKPTQTLNDICELIVDCEHKTAPTQEIGYPSIRTPNIGRGRLILEGVNRVSEETYQEWAKRAIPRGGDLILAREAPLGNVAIIPKNLKVCLGQRTVLIRPNRNKVEPSYLVYLLLGDEIQAKFYAYGSGVTVPHLNMRDIRALVLPDLPPLPTQRKIAAILSAYDDLIENNTRRIAILEDVAQAIYREWFVHFRFPGHEGVRMVESELGPVPEGWEVRCVGDFGEVIIGKTPSKKVSEYYGDYMPFIKTPSMHGNIFCIETEEYLSQLGAASQENKTLPPDTLCVSCIGSPGIVSLTTVPSQTNQQINSIILDDLSEREFLYFALLGLRETILQYAATGATMANLSKGKFTALRVLRPAKAIVGKFHQVAFPMFEQIKNLQYKSLNLRQTRDLLLPRLISGELDVSELDIDTGAPDT
jgi:type I restriction enzyme S subunit